MKKNFYLDILLLLSLLACIITGVVLDFHWFSGGREVKTLLVQVHRWTGYIGTAAIRRNACRPGSDQQHTAMPVSILTIPEAISPRKSSSGTDPWQKR